ncbi:MAG: T9SS type A sorting domain-containing protein [Muribaculum sp.]|nr:T9SS type A sorting domain-containing protein [Muribaculum sp.]
MKKLINKIALIVALAIVSPVAVSAVSFDGESIQMLDSTPTVKVVAGGVQIVTSDGEPKTFYFYSITGQLIKSVTVSDSAVVDLPQGCYIVKCTNWSKKVVVK